MSVALPRAMRGPGALPAGPVQSFDVRSSNPSSRAAAAAARHSDVFEPARASGTAAASGTRPADGLKAYEELTPRQQALLGEGGGERYAALGRKEKAAFLVLTQQMDRNRIDYGGLKLKPDGIQQDRLLFEGQPKEAVARLEQSLRAAVGRGEFLQDKPAEHHHPGMSRYGARQNRGREAMQVGLGVDGAFVDIDRFNPKADLVGLFGHLGEVLNKGKTDPFKVARALKIDLASTLPPAR